MYIAHGSLTVALWLPESNAVGRVVVPCQNATSRVELQQCILVAAHKRRPETFWIRRAIEAA
jgi:hypothetical protein